MRYEVVLGERTMIVELEALGGPLTVDGRAVAVDIREIRAERAWHVLIAGSAHDVTVLSPPRQDPLRLQVDGVEVRGRVTDARTVSARLTAKASGAHTRVEVRAPMPGLLKALHVCEGDVVDEGTGMATLEAMKMENELRSPARARVVRIAVRAGDKVEGGALLVVLGPIGTAVVPEVGQE